MEKSTVFNSHRGQAVRLPKTVEMPDNVKYVNVIAIGRTRIITPAGEGWDSWFSGPNATSDFMSGREPPVEYKAEMTIPIFNDRQSSP